MTTKIKQITLGIVCVAAVSGALLVNDIYHDKQIKAERDKASVAEQINATLRKENIALSVTIENQIQQNQALREENADLSSRIEELKSRRVEPIVSRGTYGRTTTLEISAYTSSDGLTPSTRMANGETVHVGAAAMNGVPFGTRIYVPDLDRVVVVKDRCGMDGVLDIYCDTVGECYQIGRRTCEVQVLD